MANRRMFSKKVVHSSNFLMMPLSTQALYFHLGMSADDDGYVEHFPIMRMIDAKPDELKILQAKGLVYLFDDKVLIIRDWTENNYIQADRYQASKYLTIFSVSKMDTKSIQAVSEAETECVQLVHKVFPQVRLGKDRDINTKISDVDTSAVFEKFWQLYPAREGRPKGHKAKSLELFSKIKPEDHDKLFEAVNALFCSQQYPKDCERFLKNNDWRKWLELSDVEVKS